MWHVTSSPKSESSIWLELTLNAIGSNRGKVSGIRRVIRNKWLMLGFLFLTIAFFLSLFAVLPRTHHVSGEEVISNTKRTTIALNTLNDLGVRYGGLWGNMTFMSTSSSNVTLMLEHVNGTSYKETILLSSHVPGTIPIRGLIPKEMSFIVIEGIKANLTYSYDLNYYSYPASIYGILAAFFSILGAILGFRGLFYHIMGLNSEEVE